MIRFVSLILICSVLSSCKKLDEYTKFEMDFNEKTVIPSSTGVNLPFNVFSPDIETDSENTFAINDTRKDLIEEIHLTQLDLRLTSPSNSDFSFLESISIFISAEGLSELKIAWKDEVDPNTDDTLILDIADDDLQEYIKKKLIPPQITTT
jgi:hypothetical protein